jgi:ASC-1-like (ASCH) protein
MNPIAITMIKKGSYRIQVYLAADTFKFIATDSNEGYWTAFNSLGVSVIKQKTKQAIVDVLEQATIEDLELYNNQESI